MQARVWLVIPTYNEADNIEGILRASAAELDRIAPGDYRILVVDDSSPDGTGALAERIGEQLPEVEVLHRRDKQGLGQAIWRASPGALSPAPNSCSRWTRTSRTTRAIWSRCSTPPGT